MGKILLPYIANAGQDLYDLADSIHLATIEVEEFYGEHLLQRIDVIFSRSLYRIAIDEDGIGGRAHTSSFVEIGFSRTSAPSRQLIGEMLCHEIGHAFRWQHAAEPTRCFVEDAILEGIAICLQEEFAKRSNASTFFLQTMQNRYKDIDFCQKIIKKTKHLWESESYDYDVLFYGGNEKFPRWTGYTLGYIIVSDAMSRSGDSIFDIATADYSYIMHHFMKMLPR